MDTRPDKLVFLDIDHVLTNTCIDGSSFFCYDPASYRLSQVNLAALDYVLSESCAKIVIASNWRRFIGVDPVWEFNGELYRSPLPEFQRRYSKHIIGMLPPHRHMTKCEALELWFRENTWFSKTEGRYVILEDDIKERYQDDAAFIKHLIMTDLRTGLTHEDARHAVEILNG